MSDFIPLFPLTESLLSTHRSRIEFTQSARRQISIVTAEVGNRKALSSHIPRNSDFVIEVCDLVPVFGETEKRCIGPYPVIRVY